jgi:hypothetical protein
MRWVSCRQQIVCITILEIIAQSGGIKLRKFGKKYFTPKFDERDLEVGR